jgi:hypothetical protein
MGVTQCRLILFPLLPPDPYLLPERRQDGLLPPRLTLGALRVVMRNTVTKLPRIQAQSVLYLLCRIMTSCTHIYIDQGTLFCLEKALSQSCGNLCAKGTMISLSLNPTQNQRKENQCRLTLLGTGNTSFTTKFHISPTSFHRQEILPSAQVYMV